MTTEITARDKLLLYVVGMLAFIFFFVQFMLTPALEASDEAAASLAEAQQAQIAMQETIALAGTNAAAKTESRAALQQANANYYGLLSSSDLDTLVSNLELGHDLGPVSLDISAIDTQSLTGYAASTQADDTAAPTDINSADPMLATADTNTVLMELAPPLTRIYAQADYFKQCTVTFRCHRQRQQLLHHAGRPGRAVPLGTAEKRADRPRRLHQRQRCHHQHRHLYSTAECDPLR